ncbi:MAG: serine/threonine protein kinase [Verrucomicrobiae bacterium]|nr:serine/threonine protein kinase [Verrucomicrobiae bacterium]
MSLLLPAYDVEAMLGRGGMGAVYRAVQRSLKRTVAIKVLPPTADDELKFAERFRHEAETLARLNHPGIVHIHDFGETTNGLLYLVMEFVDGTDVHQLIQANGRLSEDYALAVTAHVCDALAYAHSRGIVHRDIKPANVLIDQEGNVKVADFGLAKMVDPTFDSGLTMSNVALGTPDFVAPEVLSMGMTVDHRADLYAVGVMLYQMLTGEVPRGLFKLPSQRGFVSDERWDEIICRAMEADRDERYQSAVEVRHALDAILTGVVVAEAEAPVEMPLSTTQVGPKKRGRVIAGGIATLALVAALAIFLAQKPREESVRDETTVSTPVNPVPPGLPRDQNVIDWLNHSPEEANPWGPDWNLKDGVATVTKDDLVKQFGTIGDGEIRVRLRRTPGFGEHPANHPHGPQFQLNLRAGPLPGKPGREGHYQFQVYLPNRVCTLHFQEKDTATRRGEPVEVLWEAQSLPVNDLPDEEVEWIFRAEGDRLTATADGIEVGAVTDERLKTGMVLIQADSGTQIRKLESVGLTPMRAGPSRSKSSPSDLNHPGIQWTDITAKVREEAAANPALVVEPDGIRRAGDGSPVGITVTDPSWRNYAIRIRHSADTQINLRGGDHGMVYVLNQKLKSLIHRHDTGGTEPTILEAGIPHPSGFDINQTHELVATVEDNLFRAWVDGRPAGQVRDNAFATGAGSVAWVRQSVVHSVEVALLPESPHKAMREGFWGQVKEVNAERQVEIVEGALESINKNELSIKPTIEGGKVTALNITLENGEPLHDLSPVSALTDLKIFFCYAPGVRDLEWLRGMAIDHLQLENAWVEDFRPLRESKITHLDLDFPVKAPADYSLLAGLPLRSLSLQKCPLVDLTFLSGMALNRLVLTGTGITDYSPLKDLPLAEVELDLVPERDLPILLSIPTLKKINGKPVEEYRGK